MYKTVYYLGIRDKKDWNRWTFSQQYDTFEQLLSASSQWIKDNPGRVISFMTRKVWVPVEGQQA